MILTIDVTMQYALEPADPVFLTIAVLPSDTQTILSTAFQAQEARLNWLDQAGSAGQRVWVMSESAQLLAQYSARVAIDRPAPPLAGLAAEQMHALPTDVLAWLRPSVFCPSDRFEPFVQTEFGHLQGGAMIAAMRDWVARSLRYVPGASDSGTNALDTFVRRQGVCRDYAHLLCAFARAGGVPARYVSGYSPGVTPPDFHACAEVWLDGSWQLVDPTGMSTPDTFGMIAAGRDASDVAFMETAGMARVMFQEVRVACG